MYCMPCKNATTACTVLRFLQTYYAQTPRKLRANYETFTFVLRIEIRLLRYFLQLRLRRNTLRYVNFFGPYRK